MPLPNKWTSICLLMLLVCLKVVVADQQDTSETTEPPVPTAVELYRNFIDGNGGHANIMALKTLVIHSRMILVGSGESMEFKLYRKRPDMMRLRMNMEGYYAETIFDGERGWTQVTSDISGEKRSIVLSDEAVAELKEDNSIEGPFFQIGSNPENIVSIQHDTVLDVASYRLEIAPDAGSSYKSIWLDAETYQEIKLARDFKREEQGEPVLEEIILTRLDTVEGVHFAQQMDYYHDGEHVKTLEVDRIRANVGLFDSFFSLQPAE